MTGLQVLGGVVPIHCPVSTLETCHWQQANRKLPGTDREKKSHIRWEYSVETASESDGLHYYMNKFWAQNMIQTANLQLLGGITDKWYSPIAIDINYRSVVCLFVCLSRSCTVLK